MKNFKILNLIDIPWMSGLSDYAISQAQVLEENGFEIYWAATPNTKPYEYLKSKNKKIIAISDRKKLLTPFEIYRTYRFVKKEGINILNSHTGRMQTLSYILKSLNTDLKIVRTKADAREIKKSFTYSKVSFIITGSKYIENMYKTKGIDTPIITIYKSIKTEEYIPLEKKLPYKIGILGRLDHVKGHIFFIKAAIEVLKKGYNCKFLIAGYEAGLKWKELEKEIPEKYKTYFEYLGYIPDIKNFITSCHLGVISSIASEAVSRVAIEWQAYGRAIISTDVGSLPEFIEKDFLIKPKDSDSLSQKIIENLNFEKLEKKGKENYQKIKEKLSYKDFKNKTIDVFKTLINPA